MPETLQENENLDQTIIISFDREATAVQMETALQMVENLTTETTKVLIVGGRPNDR